jgi:biopolymer transport protein TolR
MAFGRLERPRAATPMSEINMTPLIDVMLVLLVIFIVTAPLLGTSVKLKLPTGASSTPAQARHHGHAHRQRRGDDCGLRPAA